MMGMNDPEFQKQLPNIKQKMLFQFDVFKQRIKANPHLCIFDVLEQEINFGTSPKEVEEYSDERLALVAVILTCFDAANNAKSSGHELFPLASVAIADLATQRLKMIQGGSIANGQRKLHLMLAQTNPMSLLLTSDWALAALEAGEFIVEPLKLRAKLFKQHGKQAEDWIQ